MYTNHSFTDLSQRKRVSSADLDMSMMYTIIRHACQVPPPKSGWGKQPNDNDIEIADDIERIRHKRNLICHENALNMETSDFNKSALDLIRVYKSYSKQIPYTCILFLILASFLFIF